MHSTARWLLVAPCCSFTLPISDWPPLAAKESENPYMYPAKPDLCGSAPRPLVLAVGLVGIIALLLLTACGVSSSNAGESPAATTATTAPTATSAPAAATATQRTSNAAATITMNEFAFTGKANVTIRAGQAVNFDDTHGGPHILVVGTNGTFQAQSGAPPERNSASGTTVDGDAKSITFPTVGTYQITCTLHPDMQATVSVH